MTPLEPFAGQIQTIVLVEGSGTLWLAHVVLIDGEVTIASWKVFSFYVAA